MLGIYENDLLLNTIESDLKVSEVLPKILQELLSQYEFEKLIYVHGPGSYMGIKISYVSFETLAIVKNIPLKAISAFELNNNTPISANKHLCFVKKDNGEIILEKTQAGSFFMPQSLKGLNLSKENTPFYVLDAIN
ncbi:tRNA threonylcarbamoyladenosine biosynthesis protein TsaB [Campylobacter sp. IFREMER_LSEM_CL1846]|uniref:tRNA threonylcarbamoyladenosine biosynthesis protein TsaB n=1 Tax=Campylobacter TaxID=194 RepID=UPI0014043B54|nr:MULTISPECIES: tRNA threonylcarbamoyladenosine biosynthesis protein TsaB [Campylobacter]MCR8708531.1 tRNA threonylcarbamoyladenosine biosynthesis protein TsaB [Campylobacter sp. RM5063]ELF2320834.1 tRNA threonylcarbamoyladenosine biosynthesis protein TsaB [Campylobacter lari]MBX1934237.1 tRNA threonylcarbamoyladenosine biosynthesis protein TsaB [Campylobacter lari]MCV3408980.1 tRNA threonylcarbamoyladenosine biosynthesis protein TsaB [Campylobacter sp. IFREMER_LSEM_CL1890]MCV3427337.1 tRNA t